MNRPLKRRSPISRAVPECMISTGLMVGAVLLLAMHPRRRKKNTVRV